MLQGKLLTQSLPAKSDDIFEPSPAFCNKPCWLDISCLRESEHETTNRLFNPVKDVTVDKNTSLGSFSIAGSAERDLLNHPNGQLPDSYDVEQALNQTQFSWILLVSTVCAAPSHISVEFSKIEWDKSKRDLVQHRTGLDAGSKPVKLPNCRMPMHFKTYLRQKIGNVIEHRVEIDNSPYSSPALSVPTKIG